MVNIGYTTGKTLGMLGLVKGSTIQTKNIDKNISQDFKTLVGGELRAYDEMMNETHTLAARRVVEGTEVLGANAIVNIRYASNTIVSSATGAITYGTTVTFL